MAWALHLRYIDGALELGPHIGDGVGERCLEHGPNVMEIIGHALCVANYKVGWLSSEGRDQPQCAL